MEELNIGTTLLYIFLAVLQIYILFSVGLISAFKKLYTAKSIKSISELLINFLLPIYATLELSRMATWINVEIMWILVITVFFAIFTGFFIGKFIHRIFKLDERIRQCYPYVISFPSLGTCPLVLGRALCYPGGMLEGDPNCQNILGFMMMNFLVFQIMLFVFGFILMPRDANFANCLTDKMSYIWHILIPKIFDKNYSVYFIFKKFMRDDKTALELFEVFDKKYQLEMKNTDTIHYMYKENPEVQLNFQLDIDHFSLAPRRSMLELKEIKEENEEGHDENKELELKNESYFIKSCVSELNDDSFYIEKEMEPVASNIYPTQMTKNLNTSSGFLPDKTRPSEEHLVKITFPDKNNDSVKETNEIPKEHDEEIIPFTHHKEEFHYSKEMNYVQSDMIDIVDAEANHKERMSVKDEQKIMKIIELRKQSSIKLIGSDVELYYKKLFAFVDKHLNEDKRIEYDEYKLLVFKSLYAVHPIFPIVKYKQITRDMVPIIEDEWNKFEKSTKKINTEFVLETSEIPLSISIIVNKIHSPPIIGCILGLLIGMSGMREILFSSNHYIYNIVNGIQIVTKSAVPFLYIAVGISMLSIKGINYMNTPITKKYIFISFFHRFIIIPAIGLLWVYIWKTFFGGVVASSKVFRISIFIPFCLPSTGTVVVIVNIVKYFGDETGLILFWQNTTMVITLTIIYLIYYVIIG